MVSLVLTSLNYSNATLAGVASDQLDRLQSVTNDAARLVCSAWNSDHAPAACSTNESRHRQRPRFRVETDRWIDMTDCSTLPTKCSQ